MITVMAWSFAGPSDQDRVGVDFQVLSSMLGRFGWLAYNDKTLDRDDWDPECPSASDEWTPGRDVLDWEPFICLPSEISRTRIVTHHLEQMCLDHGWHPDASSEADRCGRVLTTCVTATACQ
jgi:hypothetical protein